MLRRRFSAPATISALLSLGLAGVSAAACSVYDESLLGAGGGSTGSETTSSGDGGEGPGSGGGSTSTESTTGSTGSTASTGQTGTVTTGGGCQTPDDCPGEDSECAVRACEDNVCSVTNLQQGFVLARQSAGDCLVQICDGEGGIETANDDDDVPADDGNPCTESVCAAGSPDHALLPERTACNGDRLCTAAGACVQCLGDEDCPENCNEDTNECVSAECDDGIFNGQETDTDCGGPECGATCQLGDDCDGPGDCASGACNGTCQPSCTDGVLNNGESDVDCGGPNCDFCDFGQMCGGGGDCGSGFCLGGACRPDLFFSEYVEGSSNNKALEIFNYGNEPVDLTAAACFVRIYSNGSSSASQNIALTGTVADFGVHVLCKNTANAAILAACEQTSTLQLWNGNDAIALDCGGVVLDVFGQIGVDPGTEWGSGLTSTADNTLRRQGGVTTGDRNGGDAFDPAAQWDGFAVDTFGGLGDHP